MSNYPQSAPAPNGGNNASPHHAPLSGRDAHVQTSMQQYPARTFRAEHRERQARSAHAAHDHAMAYQTRACAVPCDRGCQVPHGHERLSQLYARSELYNDHTASAVADRTAALAHQARPLSLPPSVRRADQYSARVPTLEMREQLQRDGAQYRDTVAENASLGAVPNRAAVNRTGNFSLNASRAEKDQYTESYKQGNEEAYAHVDALQRSVRGYEDTSAETMQTLKRQNAREARQRSFLAAI